MKRPRMLLTNPIDSDKGNILDSTAQRTALAEPRSQDPTALGIETEQRAEKRMPDDVTTATRSTRVIPEFWTRVGLSSPSRGSCSGEAAFGPAVRSSRRGPR
jgi:hypothetical protein